MTKAEDQTNQQPWQLKVATKRERCQAAIPAAWRLSDEFKKSIGASASSGTNLIELQAISKSGILSARELEITETGSASDLLKKLHSGEISAEDATVAFSKRAAVAGQLTSCVTETFFDQALERAQFLDNYLKREKKPIGPLHGLPISIKDSFQFKGVDSTIGFVSFLENGPATKNSAIVQMLLDLGAVLYCKTNVPQTLMTADSDNNVFGRTLNPHNTSLTAGGSSGGEGALVALRGSLLGVGTDIAGSIRIPSLCCGVYGFRPTADRMPYGGQVSPALDGIPGIIPTAGPLATSFADLELFFKTILDADPAKYDSSAVSVPFTSRPGSTLEDLRKRPLRIGLLPEDPAFPLHPPVKRALAEASAALSKAGHEIIKLPFDPATSTAKANGLGFQLFSIDPLDTAMRHIQASGEPLVDSVRLGIPPGERHTYTIDQLAGLNVQRHDYTDAWRQTWLENRLDVVLAPGAQNTAVPHDTYNMPPYTLIWNVLDYPACIIPYGKASKELDSEPQLLQPQEGPSYNPDIVHGAPRAVQVVAPRFGDEKCLAAAHIVDEVLNGLQ
ncbi:Acetamidase [Lasiodiplodia theobromae]|uniref:Acetamidase n=1 Tax=Lasiodiplodia theobromae TaxID=45133 RepID=UPI0015C374DA|nr:Acetamidase [Lasiodiplodia theobromae]KAF4546743.1 Acetamidase [Lasiodiplodia theobromae]